MRNLLEEFDAQPPGETRPVTIVGFPEHIFTQSSGFVTAIYMAVQERYSGTWPLHDRYITVASPFRHRSITGTLPSPGAVLRHFTVT